MTVSDQSSAEMSVVIVTQDCYDTIRETLRHIRAQDVRDRLEVVIVAPSADGLGLDEAEVSDFLLVRVVEVGPIRSLAWANAAGIRQARAPVVVLAEDHCYPEPGWAEALINAHRQPWAAVGPVVHNANPDSSISWADALLGYAPWLDPAPAGVIDHLPGHNSSYKRAILLDYGPDLEAMLEAESVLHWDLRAKGHQLYLEPAAKVSHVNFGRLSSWIPAQFHSGRVFAAARGRSWSPLRRLLYAGGAPFIPLVRSWRILRRARRVCPRHQPLKVLPALMLGLVVSALGELLGYASGAGDAKQKLSTFEFHRVRHLANQGGRAGSS
jgi:glycosyltransferase involved in cell wall biosynthesis